MSLNCPLVFYHYDPLSLQTARDANWQAGVGTCGELLIPLSH